MSISKIIYLFFLDSHLLLELGIELGLNGIKTLILEKHEAPLLSPRAQSLNARSMEFFMRWKLDDKLKAKQLLPPNFPIRGVWCSSLNGNTYAVSSSNEQLSDDISPQRGIRMPLYLTEEVLRDQLSEFNTVTFLKPTLLLQSSTHSRLELQWDMRISIRH